MSAHTPGALRAAHIIMNGKEKILTEYGTKRAEGIADLIEHETAAPELLEACKKLLAAAVCNYDPKTTLYEYGALAEAAIARAEGRQHGRET